MENLKSYNNLFLISGTGRKTGKTSFACQLIRERTDIEITAIKISCHFHPQPEMSPIFEKKDQYQIFEEKRRSGSKDSSKMLAAGAKQVFYIQAKKGASFQAFQKASELIPAHTPVLCESGGLGSYLKPGIHLVLRRPIPEFDDKMIHYHPDFFVEMRNNDFSISPAHFIFSNGKWQFLDE